MELAFRSRRHSLSHGCSPDQRGSRVAPGVAKVEDQRQVAVLDGDAAEVDDTGDTLLFAVVRVRDALLKQDEGRGSGDVPWSPRKTVATPFLINLLVYDGS